MSHYNISVTPGAEIEEGYFQHLLGDMVSGGVAETSKSFLLGDCIVSINGVSVTSLEHHEVVALVRESVSQISLQICQRVNTKRMRGLILGTYSDK